MSFSVKQAVVFNKTTRCFLSRLRSQNTNIALRQERQK